jgi:hypothetical protein
MVNRTLRVAFYVHEIRPDVDSMPLIASKRPNVEPARASFERCVPNYLTLLEFAG